MSKSDDNTNELESYGVWVKNTTGEDTTPKAEPADTSDELNLDDVNLDLPDFDDSEFSDMFKDDSQTTDSNISDDFGNEDDTTLSMDELANITDSVAVEQVEAEPETSTEEDFSIDNDIAVEEPVFENTDEQAVTEDDIFSADEDLKTEEAVFDDMEIDTDSLSESTEENTEETAPDFSEEVSEESPVFDEMEPPEAISEENNIDSTESNETVEFNLNENGEEEISLDDFMDGGFSDESVAAGNNGYEPGAEPKEFSEVSVEPSGETEELSLDDFMDGESFDTEIESSKEEEIEDEAPLDMDISFDDSADTIETEDNISLEQSFEDDDESIEEEEEAPAEQTEEISMEDFGTTFVTEEEEPHIDTTSQNLSTEDIDLSDFGIDANAEETPIVQDVEAAKKKDQVIDYDLAVGDENTSAAPVVNEIKSNEEKEETVNELTEENSNQNKTSVDNSILQQIVSELSSLKDEMTRLKTNIDEIKNHPGAGAAVAAGVAGAALGAAAVASTSNDDFEIPEDEPKDQGGFFSDDDGDDTIALSFDELDNIMNTADFGDTVEAAENTDDKPADEITPEETEDIIIEEEPVIEETAVEEPLESFNLDSNEEASFEELSNQNSDGSTIGENETQDTVFDESIIETEPQEDEDISENNDSIIEEAIITDDSTSLDNINFEEQSEEDLSFDFENENLEEPEIDNIVTDGDEELFENGELPDEISIPKEDDLLVESTSSDFMDSVKESSEETQAENETVIQEPVEEAFEETAVEETEVSEPVIEESSVDSFEQETPFETVEEAVSDEGEEDLATVDSLLNEMEASNNLETSNETESFAPEFDENSNQIQDEPVISCDDNTIIEDTISDEPLIEDETSEAQPEEIVEETFDEVDNLDNNLSESNLSYLSKGTETSPAMNSDLKQDIKSVLLYMDQLLENLPEEKIVEFAKSDEFVTYKKLFSELGLS